MAHDRDRYDRDPYDRDRYDRDRPHRDRGMFDRAGDEVRAWFGDDDARRRRERDDREPERTYRSERSYGSDRPYGERTYGRSDRWDSEIQRSEGYREYGDRYGRPYSTAIDRDRDIGRGPAFQPYARGVEIPYGTGSQEFGPEGYGAARRSGSSSAYGREWRSTEAWRVPGPHAGRGPRGYQRSDERIREELNDRLTAHGLIDATDIEVRVQAGEVTLVGFVDSREAKREAEDVAEDLPGVREVHNQLRIRTHSEDASGVGRTNVLGLTEHETQTAETAKAADAAGRSRARNT